MVIQQLITERQAIGLAIVFTCLFGMLYLLITSEDYDNWLKKQGKKK